MAKAFGPMCCTLVLVPECKHSSQSRNTSRFILKLSHHRGKNHRLAGSKTDAV